MFGLLFLLSTSLFATAFPSFVLCYIHTHTQSEWNWWSMRTPRELVKTTDWKQDLIIYYRTDHGETELNENDIILHAESDGKIGFSDYTASVVVFVFPVDWTNSRGFVLIGKEEADAAWSTCSNVFSTSRRDSMAGFSSNVSRKSTSFRS